MKNHQYILLLALLAFLCLSCKHNLAPEVINDTEKFDEYWNSLDSASRAELAEQISRKELEAYLGSQTFIDDNSEGITANDADRYTARYYSQFTSQQALDTATKSVHFDIPTLERYLNIIRSKCASNNLQPGLRIYFAQYDNEIDDDDLRGRTTVILRGTGNYKDLAHDPNDETNQNYVAWNYGDPCPPRCDKNENGNIQRFCDGRYQSGGHARTSDCDE